LTEDHLFTTAQPVLPPGEEEEGEGGGGSMIF